MLIENKYFYIATGESYLEHPPILYLDWFLVDEDPRFKWKNEKTFYFLAGFFGLHVQIELYLGRKKSK